MCCITLWVNIIVLLKFSALGGCWLGTHMGKNVYNWGINHRKVPL